MIQELKKILIESQKKIIDETEKEISKKMDEFIREKGMYEGALSEWSKEEEKYETTEYKQAKSLIEKYENAVVISDLGLNIQEAINLLVSNHVPVVLTEEDKKSKENRANYSSKKDFICVHKTNYAPDKSRIKTSKEAGATLEYEFKFHNKSYKTEYLQERETVHTCVNGEVSGRTRNGQLG